MSGFGGYLAGFCWVPARGVFVDLIGVIGISQVRMNRKCFFWRGGVVRLVAGIAGRRGGGEVGGGGFHLGSTVHYAVGKPTT
jgi:hypothetical protein